MQTLRKRSSPCKYKNEPSRFLGEGMTFKAKLIGILEVNEARGDKMCQDALNDLKTAIRAAGEHKQRITISIAIDGLRLRDEKSGDCLYHHPVHKISFIAQDMSDSRAFGYIFGSPDTGHRFFGIKTDKTASQVVISMRDLFQVVFELKKKEIEMAKHHIEQRQIKYGTTGNADSIHSLKDDYENDKSKGKYPQLIKIRCVTSKSADSGSAGAKTNASEAIADLLDLQHELNNIQQGINQMERITPSDPFGPLSKGDPFLDPFEDSFSSPKVDCLSEVKVPPPLSSKTLPSKARTTSQSCSADSPTELDKSSSLFGGGSSSTTKPIFFSQFSQSPATKPNTEETHWFDQETESLFNDRTKISNTEPTSSPISFSTLQDKADADQVTEGKRSPMKPDVFMELDPLGTGWVKPYVDKKDFFQDLKNPPKKVLKELLTENSAGDNQFLGLDSSNKSSQNTNSTPSKELATSKGSAVTNTSPSIFSPAKETNRYSKMDPFDDADPFEKADPFSEKNFPVEMPSLFGDRSFESVFPDVSTFEKTPKEEEREESVFSSSSIHGPLRVSLPPEKSDTNTPISLSSITSKFRSSPSPTDDSKTLRRRNYKVLKHAAEDKSDETPRSPVHEEFFATSRSPKEAASYSPKISREKRTKKFWSEDFPEETPNPPTKPKAALFSIKPPPLPPKKQNNLNPPARPPSLEESSSHYDYLRNQEESRSPKTEPVKPKENFPLLPPPPQRKEKASEAKTKDGTGSVLNLTLNQLDNTGLENLAVTLGIPSDHIYNMTLQELTKRLSVKYMEKSQGETFQADFESNFGKPDTANTAPYDKYAVFKELIENDNKVNGEEREEQKEEGEEEDRYAALRQLSVNPQENEEDEEEDVRVENPPEEESAMVKSPKEAVNNGEVAKVEEEESKENWATFEPPAEVNDNSPFSSDGKDDSFEWKKKEREVPWRDEDESWDDYSPKESYWSEESSREERSPEKRRDGRYQRRTWSKQIRKSKGRRCRWNEETEDEYEEWKKHRCRMGSCDADRKAEICPLNNYEWCNSRDAWEESDRYRCCRKKSESDDEYRRRCDSDTSDREYVWTFKRSYPEGYSKQKQYHMLPYTSRDYQERCHEPRSKHRKAEGHKRPSSASEGKRNYEKMYSSDHISNKGKRTTPEEDSPSYHKEFRYCCAPSEHYDRRQPCKKPGRSRRDEQCSTESKEKKDSFEYYKSTWQKAPEESRRSRHYQFEDDFTPMATEKPTSSPSRSPRQRLREEWSGDAFEVHGESEPNVKESDRASGKQMMGKNHFSVLTRQESSTSLRKSESINIFSRENDPFEGDDFFASAPAASHKLNRFTSEKSRSNSNVSDAFTWKEVFGESSFRE